MYELQYLFFTSNLNTTIAVPYSASFLVPSLGAVQPDSLISLAGLESPMAELVAEFLPFPSVGLLSVVRSVFHGPDMTRKIIRAKSKTFQSERLKKSYFISWGSLKYVSVVRICNF